MNPESAPRAGARVRWGIPDVALAWLAGVLLSLFAFPFGDTHVGAGHQPIRFYLAAIILQNLGTVLALIFISKRKDVEFLDREVGPKR